MLVGATDVDEVVRGAGVLTADVLGGFVVVGSCTGRDVVVVVGLVNVAGVPGTAVFWKHWQALDTRLAGKLDMNEGAVEVPARYPGQNAKAAER